MGVFVVFPFRVRGFCCTALPMKGHLMNNTVWATSFFDRTRGLLAKRRFSGILVLAPCRSIHTFCMRVEIDVAFLDKNGRVLEEYRKVAPGKILRHKKAVLALERIATSKPWFTKGESTGICSTSKTKEGVIKHEKEAEQIEKVPRVRSAKL